MNRRETERLLAAIRSVQRAGRHAALATVVRVRGSAYRREGARILVRQDGSYECLLSGGCLEPAVAKAAARVIETGTPVLAQYDLEEDSVWSLGVGCSGAVDILIDRIGDDPITRAWLDVLEAAAPGALIRALSGSEGRLLLHKDGTLGSLGDAALDREAVAYGRALLKAPFPHAHSVHLAAAELFFDVSVPPPLVTIFGAGADAEPLVRQAWDLGFDVTVVDVREAFLTAERFPRASLVQAHFSRFQEAVRLTARSSIVVMNHHLERDREALRFALRSPAPFIGVLGPRPRFERLMDGLRAEGFLPDASALARVRSPVGLALGAETPEEIAVSILGEILALQRGFDGGFLTGRGSGLHRAAAAAQVRA
jgi:xanthine/CO dehydrogenase XdhC/CoxF family maturation factor